MCESICETDKYGDKRWYLDEKFHRIDGPAVEWTNGHKSWYLNGIRHRTDGPAMEYTDGSKYWYLHGTQYTFDEFAIEMNWTTEEIVIWKLQHA
jgi:hypothetical protein